MKKFFAIFLIICNLMFLIGCSNNYRKVCSISLNINGKWQTFESEYIVATEKTSTRITETEYYKSERKYRISSTSTLSYSLNTYGEYYDPGFKINDFLYWYDDWSPRWYHKIKVIDTYIRYVYVFVENSNTIHIKFTENGTVTTYHPTAYRIVEFKN